MPVSNDLFLRAVLALSLTCLLSLGCKRTVSIQPPVSLADPETLKLSAEVQKNIKIVAAKIEDLPETLSVMGKISVTEDRMTVVPARVSGRIDAVYVASGEQVAKDQILASIFSSDYVVAREEYLQALTDAQKLDLNGDGQRMIQLARKKLKNLGMTSLDIDKIKESEKNEAAVMVIRAPRAGALLDKKAIVGTLVNTGDTLFTLGDLSKVWFAGDLYTEDVSKVHKAQDVSIDSLVPGVPPIQGKISFISLVIDPISRTIKIRALMDNPQLALRGDMYVKGSLILTKKPALQIPASSVLHLHDTDFCFKSMGNSLFHRVTLTLGEGIGGNIEVKSGLQEGDQVVAEGALLLEGALVGSENN